MEEEELSAEGVPNRFCGLKVEGDDLDGEGLTLTLGPLSTARSSLVRVY